MLIDRAMETDYLRMATIFCLIGNEGISILENLSKLGVPIPKKILNTLIQLRSTGDEDETEEKE